MRRQTKKFIALKLKTSFWKKACQLDGISENSLFVVLSSDNIYSMAYNRAIKLFNQLS